MENSTKPNNLTNIESSSEILKKQQEFNELLLQYKKSLTNLDIFAFKIKKEFKILSSEFIESNLRKLFIDLLSTGRWSGDGEAKYIKKYFESYFPPEFISSPEVISIAEKGFVRSILHNHYYDSARIFENFNLSPEFISSPEVVSVGKKKFLDQLLGGDVNNANLIKNNFNLPPEFISSPEVISIAEKGFVFHLSKNEISEAIKLKDEFYLSPELIQTAVKKEFIKKLSEGNINTIIRIKNNFNLPPEFISSPEVISIAEEVFADILSTENIESAFSIDKEINLTEIMKIKAILGNINNPEVVKNISNFNINPEKFFDKAKEFYTENMEELKNEYPKLLEQVQKSTEILADILNLFLNADFYKIKDAINKNPFLLEALEENPRYASKLLLKYHEFDKESKGNIKELFNDKSKIVNDNLKIDPQSVEFRKLMQDKLSVYKNNPQILEEMKNRGINVESWLNYKESINFSLGEEENVKFSDKIETPIKRLKETLKKYQNSIVNVFSEYKDELMKAFVPNPEIEILEEKIKEIGEKIKNEKDQGKAKGMEKGLTSLKAKLESLRPISLWDRIQSDIFRLKSMIENISKFHNLCLLSETAIENTKDKKELIKEKDKLGKDKSQLKEKLKEFEVFFESFENRLKELIIPALKEERSESLMQEIKGKMGEEFSHYGTDKNTLNDIFKDEEKDNNELKGREMKISIASRNPDQDLYLGNYCTCCIRIESEHHGEESPITDYITDLGMQNIVVYDEKKNIPVVACWAFIGEDSPSGEPILVIDNIEANTNYTNAYPEKLKEIIAKFAKDYAKASNIKEIVQGPHNNDLEVFPLREVGKKLGGIYNRSDGYFLEAEKDENEDEEENQEGNEDYEDDDN